MGSCIGIFRSDKSTLTQQAANANDATERIEDVQPASSTSVSHEASSPPLPEAEFFSLTVPHLSPHIPPRPEFTPFTVPYLCACRPYDGKGFWTYPERHGWIVHMKDTNCHVLCPPGKCRDGMSLEAIGDKDMRLGLLPLFSRSDGTLILASDKVAFLQAWLFFGLLMEVSTLCGLEIDVEAEFMDKEGSVSTAKLNTLPGRWFMALLRTHRVGDKMLMERILSLVRHAILMLMEELVEVDGGFAQRFKYTYTQCRVLHSLNICTRIIGLHLLSHVYSPRFSATEEDGWGRKRITKSLEYKRYGEGMDQLSDLARTDLEERGWCESELDLLTSDDLAFASLLTRPNMRDHSGCRGIVCNAYQSDEATYITRHVQDRCSCDFVGVQTSVLVDALSKEKVPKLVITENLELQVVAEHDYPYIALSHVWADGLGNPTTNSLPRCQLSRLRDLANELHHASNPISTTAELPIGLWMDTLCIPVDPGASAYRKKAIKLLGETFNQANAVLILDRELEIVEATTASFLELGVRILCSGWVKRLWTLQEATLASEAHGMSKLYFQMCDGPFLYQKYDRDRSASRRIDVHTTEMQAEERTLLNDQGIMLELGAQIPSVRAMRNIREGWSPFQVIYTALEHRSTSRAEDIPVCITSLLGMDLSTILSSDNVEQRMANFYVLMREVPCGVIWNWYREETERLSIKPFRWVPSSITTCPPSLFFMDWKTGICDTSGLHVRYHGFLFAEKEEEQHGTKAVLPHVFNIAFFETGDVFGRLCLPLLGAPLQIPLQRNIAVILRQHDNKHMLPTAAIVVVEDTVEMDGEMRLTEFVCRIVGYMAFQPPDRDPGTDVFRGYVTAGDQRWCIT